jgi:hypothetical protein
MSIATRKIGSTVHCPKCRHGQVVPGEGGVAIRASSSAEERERDSGDEPADINDLLENSDFDRLIGKGGSRRERGGESRRPFTDEGRRTVSPAEEPARSRGERSAREEPDSDVAVAEPPPRKSSPTPWTAAPSAKSAEPVRPEPSRPEPRPAPVRPESPRPDPRAADPFRVATNVETPPAASRHLQRKPNPLFNAEVFAVMGMLLSFALGVTVGRYAFPNLPTAAPGEALVAGKDGNREQAAAQAAQQPAAEEKAAPVEPALKISGNVGLRFNRELRPDAGACVILLPIGVVPIEKISHEGLRPEDPPRPDSPGAKQLARYGGAISRVDAQGEYAVPVPAEGKYWVVILSKGGSRDLTKPLLADDKQILEKYFANLDDLLGPRDFKLVQRDIKPGNIRKITFNFDG